MFATHATEVAIPESTGKFARLGSMSSKDDDAAGYSRRVLHALAWHEHRLKGADTILLLT